jgi:L-iditol 2-dehydrogenase
MLIARYYNNRSIRLERIDKPTIGEGEVLVRVMACGICGSDVMEWFRTPKSPRILGHELSGVVAESRSDACAPGDRVVVRNQVPCGACHACEQDHHSVCERMVEIEPGGMAEYIRLPSEVVRFGLFPLPSRLSFAAGTLAEPIACTLHAQALARVEPHHCVVVIGSGLFGLLHIQIARANGVRRIAAIEKVEYRRSAAERLGACLALHPDQKLTEAIRDLNDSRLADVAIVATGAPEALAVARRVLCRHGTIMLFGAIEPEAAFPLSPNQLFWRSELRMVSSYGAGKIPFSRPLELIERGDINSDALITDTLPFAKVQEGFDIVVKAQNSLKVVLDISRAS